MHSQLIYSCSAQGSWLELTALSVRNTLFPTLSFSNFPETVDGFNVFFYRNMERNMHLTDGKIKSALHISLISLFCAITHVAICRCQQPFTLSFTNCKYCGCSGRKEKYLEEVEMIREAALRCCGRRSVVCLRNRLSWQTLRHYIHLALFAGEDHHFFLFLSSMGTQWVTGITNSQQ